MNGGLPFYGNLTDATAGTTAQAFAPAHANLERTLATQPGLPNGFATQARTDLDAQQARAFDQGLVGNMFAQEQAKQAGASGLLGQAQIANPLGYYGTALQGNQSIMQAPLQKPGLGGLDRRHRWRCIASRSSVGDQHGKYLRTLRQERDHN
jgi:hypothetical protein